MKYNKQKIAEELLETARGTAYFGSALKAANDLNVGTVEETIALQRYLNGRDTDKDRFRLQDLAFKIQSA